MRRPLDIEIGFAVGSGSEEILNMFRRCAAPTNFRWSPKFLIEAPDRQTVGEYEVGLEACSNIALMTMSGTFCVRPALCAVAPGSRRLLRSFRHYPNIGLTNTGAQRLAPFVMFRSPSDYSHRVPKHSSHEPWTVIDLFAGVGGLSFGFAHRPDFQVVAANEILPEMAKAYRANHPQVAMFEGDIKDFSARALRRETQLGKQSIDVIVGGPPCQAYSTVGKRLLEDPRAQLFKEYFRLLKELKPRLFIYENVKGLISMNDGQLLDSIIDLFGSLGYKIQAVVLNAADYGVPQTRERVIVVGTAGNLNFRYPEATHRDPSLTPNMLNMTLPAWRTLGDAIGDLPEIAAGGESFEYATTPQNEYQLMMRLNAPKRLMDHNSPNHGESLIRVMDALPEGGGLKDLPDSLRPKSGFPNTYARLWWDRPSTTITRNLGTPSSSRCVHPHVSRGLTTREGARVQSFPDRFTFSGSRTDRNLQIGNAVPCLLSVALAKQVSHALGK